MFLLLPSPIRKAPSIGFLPLCYFCDHLKNICWEGRFHWHLGSCTSSSKFPWTLRKGTHHGVEVHHAFLQLSLQKMACRQKKEGEGIESMISGTIKLVTSCNQVGGGTLRKKLRLRGFQLVENHPFKFGSERFGEWREQACERRNGRRKDERIRRTDMRFSFIYVQICKLNFDIDIRRHW